ncbi:hypothetical protein GLX27_000576 [Malassezia furfur]|uniref:Uncharacterized protein n=1 Tax=Malassezia furfur TaxID=55194 RepID=A0ABY8ELT8_MALFU|nr:hypothetical protein GLX27_000576 [Malassezia furfur]
MPKRPPATPSRRAANSPFAKLAENTASPSSTPPHGGAGKVGSPRTAPEPRDPHDAFLIPRTAEQTYHRRLRALLQDFLKEATAWEEEHTLEGIKWASDAKQTWEEISNLLRPTNADTQTARDDEQIRSSVVPLLQNLEQASAQLAKMLDRLRKHSAKINALADMGTDLLIETADGGRDALAFSQPMWATWTMEQFVLALRSLSLQYAVSTTEIAALIPKLCRPFDDPDMHRKRRSALEAFVRLPHLHPSGLSSAAPAFASDASLVTGASRHFLENVCEVEVRGW